MHQHLETPDFSPGRLMSRQARTSVRPRAARPSPEGTASAAAGQSGLKPAAWRDMSLPALKRGVSRLVVPTPMDHSRRLPPSPVTCQATPDRSKRGFGS